MNEQQLNSEVKAWANKTKNELKAKAKSLGIEHRENSPSGSSSTEAIKASVAKKFRIVSRVSFKFPRHMIFVHKGLGRDTPVSKQGTTNRKAKEWLDGPIEKNIDQLADIVAEHIGDEVIARMNF